VYDKQNPTTAVKTISFTQDYFGNTAAETSCWLKLKKVTIQGGGSNQEYTFSYVNENAAWGDMDKQKLSIDHWGYYNFKGNVTLVPLTGTLQSQLQHESSLGTGIIPWANRDPDFAHACSFALETTEYPTKGFTKITYESADGKGIRVASLEDFDGEKSNYRYYNYGPSFTWPAYYFPTTYYSFIDCGLLPGRNNMQITTYGSTPEGGIDYYAETDAFHESVMEYIGTPDGKAGRINYKYQRLPSDYGNKSLLTEKDTYKYGSNDIISQEKYNYLPVSLKTINYWMIPEMSSVALPGGTCTQEPNYRPSCGPLDPVKGFILASLSSSGVAQLNSYWIRLDNTVTAQDNVQVVKRFSYADIDPVTGVPRQTQPIKIEEDLSNGTVKQTFMYYPGDSDPDNSSYKLGLPQMWDPSNTAFVNLISPPLKTRTVVNNMLVSKATLQFTADPSTGNILLSRHELYPTGADADKIVTNLKYDNKANVTDIKKDNDLNKAFYWGYNKNYAIATANNAASNEIFFSSFEEGGWDNSLTAYDNATKHAGRFSGRIDKSTAGDQVSVSTSWLNISRSTPTNFKFSGWVYTTGPVAKIDLLMKTAAETGPYTYISSITSNTSNKWVFIQGEYTVPANVTMLTIRLDNTGGGTVWFDDVRLHPSAAKMVTYTYDPLIGMTSETDVNNRTTSYEYDTYGRLAFIRDQDGNILKKYCYNFYGQPEDCSGLVNVTPYWQYTGETRCKPCPANSIYTSKILQKRYKDINPNSQSHDVQIWIDAGESTACVPLANSEIINSYCLKDNNGNNTGWQYQQYKIINPCNDYYGSIYDGVYSNTDACPLPPPPPPPPPPNCTYENCTYQEGYKCINDNCEQGYKVVTSRYWIEDLHQYEITYHYEFSDGSVSDDYGGYE